MLAIDGLIAVLTEKKATDPIAEALSDALVHELLVRRGESVQSSDAYAGCYVTPRLKPPNSGWLMAMGDGDRLLAVFDAPRPFAALSKSRRDWSIADSHGNVLEEGSTDDISSRRSHGRDVWIVSISWGTGAHSFRIASERGVVEASPSAIARMDIDVRAAEAEANAIEVSWPHRQGDGFARIDYRCHEPSQRAPWTDLVGVVREADIAEAGVCRVVVGMKGMHVADQLELRVQTSTAEARSSGTAVLPWEVPPPQVVWTAPTTEEVSGEAVLVAVSAYAPGLGRCLESEEVRWFVDDELAASGSRASLRCRPGTRSIRVECVDPAGRRSIAERTVQVGPVT